jgi:hypothetical protein
MENFSRDFYETLDLPRDATEKQIKKAYRRLVMRFHPDRNPGNPEAEKQFRQVQAAYEVAINGKGPQGISPVSFTERSGTMHCATSNHPFYSFFSAVRAYYSKRTNRRDLKR